MEKSNPQQQEQPQGTHKSISEQNDSHAGAPEKPAAVRFASEVEEIVPAITTTQTSDEPAKQVAPEQEASGITPEAIRALSQSLQGAGSLGAADQRMKNYTSFEPISLPVSRVPSNEDSPEPTPQQSHSPMGMSYQSPRTSPKMEMASPPLTPSGTSGPEASSNRGLKPGSDQSDGGFGSQAITPQASGQEGASVQSSPRIQLPHRPASENQVSRTSAATEAGESSRHRKGVFQVGPGGSSVPSSRDSSPSRLSAAAYYSRPFTPDGDANDPFAAKHRKAQNRPSAANIEQRFRIDLEKVKRGRRSPGPSSTGLSKMDKADKRNSGLLGVLNKHNHDLHHTGTESTTHSRQSSMVDLRRFFKGGSKMKKSASPAPKPGTSGSSGSRSAAVPFADDHGLSSKYGKLGKVLGSGAGGSVKLMKRTEDNKTFAVKEFRPRHTYETEKEYVKKLTAEFCVGSTLHNGNIIETLDIVQEKGKWYEVMEYAPYDLFAIVMTGRMTKPEVTCCFLQILSGVTYLHSMGLAHRDLKLDNVVVSEHGIMKIIDFGSAHVFKYPFETDINLASGIVGSDPYLAPEVYDERKYDPQAVDIWSLAIIFCCMSLRRFPWKIPRMTDNSYKLFASEPTPGHDPKQLVVPSRSTNALTNTPRRDRFPEEEEEEEEEEGKDDKPVNPAGSSSAATEHGSATTAKNDSQGTREVIRGPWRLLRLLPRESRHIIHRMLEIKPHERAKMDEILSEPWVSNTIICRQEDTGEIRQADDHKHILEPPAPGK